MMKISMKTYAMSDHCRAKYVMKELFLASILITIFSAPISAEEKAEFVTSLNGVQVELKGTFAEPNNIIIQSELPVFEFEGLTVRGGEQIVESYNKTFGDGYILKKIKSHNETSRKYYSDKQLAAALKTTQDFVKDFPEIQAFYQGFANATGATLDQVLLASWSEDGNFGHHMLEVKEAMFGDKKVPLFFENKQPNKGCTVVGFNNGILGQTMDLAIEMTGQTVVWKSPDLIVDAVSPFYTGMAMSRNMASQNNTIDVFSTLALENGAPQSLVYLAVIMNADNVDDAAKLLSKYRTNASGVASLADKDGGLSAFEYHADGIRRIPAEFGYLVHTNHPIGQEQELANTLTDGNLDAFNQIAAQTLGRYELAESFMRWDIERSVGSIQSLFRSRPVVMAPTKTNSFITASANVSDLNAGCMYVTPYRPDLTDFVKICFNK